MSFNLEQSIRPSILTLKPYQSARSLTTEGSVFLDANEAPLPPTFSEKESVLAKPLNRYPAGQPSELSSAFANFFGVPSSTLLMGRGSDEAVDLLTRAFCEQGQDSVLITPPTYGMYEVSAAIQGAGVVRVPLLQRNEDWSLDVERIVETSSDSSKRVKIIYLCSPSNPTGTLFPLSQIRDICKSSSALVVVDEAYIEFAQTVSAVSLLDECENLVILRTLSKAWAMAGIRCGVAIGRPNLISLLQKIRSPYPLAQPIVSLALQTLKDPDQMHKRVTSVIAERQRVQNELTHLDSVRLIYTSHANFLLVRFSDEKNVMQTAAKAGIILRSRHFDEGLENCVRITIGTKEENDQLLQVLRRIPS